MLEKRMAAEAHQGRDMVRQAESANLSALPKKIASNAPKWPGGAEKEGI